MLQYLRNVVSGRIGHWSKTHNAALNDLLQKSKGLHSSDALVLKHFAVATAVLLKDIFIPDTKRIFDVDVKRLAKSDFLAVYSIILSYFVFLFVSKNSFLADRLPLLVGEITDNPARAADVHRLLVSRQGKQRRGDPPDLPSLGSLVWQETAMLLAPDRKIEVTEQVAFSLFAATNYNHAAEMISREFGVS